jgi:UV DNA damage endonuclease
MFLEFINAIKGTVPEIYCMIEAKQKDAALFQLMDDLRNRKGINVIDQSSFVVE